MVEPSAAIIFYFLFHFNHFGHLTAIDYIVSLHWRSAFDAIYQRRFITPVQQLQLRAAHGMPICSVVLLFAAVGCAIESKREAGKNGCVPRTCGVFFWFCSLRSCIVWFDWTFEHDKCLLHNAHTHTHKRMQVGKCHTIYYLSFRPHSPIFSLLHSSFSCIFP